MENLCGEWGLESVFALASYVGHSVSRKARSGARNGAGGLSNLVYKGLIVKLISGFAFGRYPDKYPG